MKTILRPFLFLTVLLSLCAAAIQSASAQNPVCADCPVLIVTSSANLVGLRDAATTAARVVVRVPSGSAVRFTGERSDQGAREWLQVIYMDLAGWMPAQLLQSVDGTDLTVPEAAASTTLQRTATATVPTTLTSTPASPDSLDTTEQQDSDQPLAVTVTNPAPALEITPSFGVELPPAQPVTEPLVPVIPQTEVVTVEAPILPDADQVAVAAPADTQPLLNAETQPATQTAVSVPLTQQTDANTGAAALTITPSFSAPAATPVTEATVTQTSAAQPEDNGASAGTVNAQPTTQAAATPTSSAPATSEPVAPAATAVASASAVTELPVAAESTEPSPADPALTAEDAAKLDAESLVRRITRRLPQKGEVYQVVGITGQLRIRSAPGTDFAVIGTIPANAPAVIALGDAHGNWMYVRHGNDTGWASADFLQRIF